LSRLAARVRAFARESDRRIAHFFFHGDAFRGPGNDRQAREGSSLGAVVRRRWSRGRGSLLEQGTRRTRLPRSDSGCLGAPDPAPPGALHSAPGTRAPRVPRSRFALVRSGGVAESRVSPVLLRSRALPALRHRPSASTRALLLLRRDLPRGFPARPLLFLRGL